ncbi:glycosyltransferase family 4 protein [Blastopirellula sp. J2-11]|uniref:glycosyltransferase family 4 protein n=1 Tax=Blastopirellula sp. J2-11 TaxID=2943192 RepID=UPI0021C7C844|nr:glycosyltransferase family 4 protein [Blastopirellula sp. J2-11]UUO05918.1 glycosyltransferase family 4 protein [Blastopirellula sp. J2-11]
MSGLRIAMVTRRFWPLVGGAEMVMANLAQQLRRQAADVRIVTARWQKNWPERIVHREIPILRLPNPQLRGWGTLRYMMSLGKYLQQHQAELDAVYVSMLKHSAYMAVERLKNTSTPIVLRAEGGGETGDCRWQAEANFGLRIRAVCQQADAIVAPSAAIREELLAAGYDPAKLHFIPNGVAIPAAGNQQRRFDARMALQSAQPLFSFHNDMPLAVYTGRLHPKKGLLTAIEAWPHVLQRFPDAKLVLVGEGPQESQLRERIESLRLQERVFLPGVFDDVSDLLDAADFFLLPSHEEGMSLSLLEAMAAGLPVIATDIPGNRQLVESGRNGLLFPVDDVAALQQEIVNVIHQPIAARQMGEAARAMVTQKYSLTAATTRHLDLFAELRETKRSVG